MFRAAIKSLENEDISVLVSLDNHSQHYLCECGDASGLTVKECQDIAAIFLSHTHIDHFVNFDFVLRHQLGIQRTVVVCGPTGITEQVQSRIKSYQWNLIEAGAITYEVREILNEQEVRHSILQPPLWEIEAIKVEQQQVLFANEQFAVHYTILDHKTDSIAYLFKANDQIKIDLKNSAFKGGKWIQELKQAFAAQDTQREIVVGEQTYPAQELFPLLSVKKGDTLGIIMDHAAHAENHQKIEQLFMTCRKVLIESFYKAADQAFALQNYHSYSLQSAAIMRRCQVEEAIPVHFSRKYRAVEIEELKTEFYQALEAEPRS